MQIIWQTRCRYRIAHKNAHIRRADAPSGFKTHDRSVWSEEKSMHFRLRGLCD